MPVRTFDLLRTEAEFRALRSEWEQLYLTHQPRNPFLSPEWGEACWERCPAHTRPFVLTLREGSRLVGLAALRLERHWGFRLLRFLGDGRSDYLGFLHLPGHVDADQSLLAELALHGSSWDVALLRPLAEPYSRLYQLPPPPGLRGCIGGKQVASFVAHPGGWEELRAAGPGWLGRMEKRRRKWERVGGEIQRFTDADAADQVGVVARIEAGSWKGHAGTARYCSPAGQQFLHRTLRELGKRGEMELWLAFHQGVPVAFEINLLTPERIWLYQGAYDEAHRKLGSGSLLEFCSIQRAWEAGAREYDYLSGEEEYKAERTNATRSVYRMALYPDTLRGRLAGAFVMKRAWGMR